MDFNTKLIELVKHHKFLYDANDPRGDVARKDETWKEISKKLQVQESECKKSWTLLREGFRRAMKKQKASESDPAPRKDKYTRKWTYVDEMAFLTPYLKQRPCSKSKDMYAEESSPNPDNQASRANTEVLGRRHSHVKRRRSHEAAPRRSCLHESYSNSLIKYMLDKSSNRDDVQQFFESISSTVQSFPARDRAVAKARVFEVISQMELQILGRGSTPFFQYEGLPASYAAGVTKNDLFIAPSPDGPSSGVMESYNNSDDELESEHDIKVEPEQILGLNIKQGAT